MDLHIQLRYVVLGLEVLLTGSLITWMRSSVRGTPISWRMISAVLLFGALAALISAFVTLRYSFNIPTLQQQLPDLVDKYKGLMILFNTVGASLVEELAKYTVAVFLLITPRQQNQKLSDTIIYMILIGLGFSLIEDWLYLLNPDTAAPYRLLSFYLHSGTCAIMGYSLGRFRFGLTGYREVFRSVCAAVLLHATYNLTTQLNNQQLALYLTFAITIFISLQIFILFRKTLEEEYRLENRRAPKPIPTKLLNLKPTVD
jgi:RsiW-degrading membrane proteinase PrsW (M82 family)